MAFTTSAAGSVHMQLRHMVRTTSDSCTRQFPFSRDCGNVREQGAPSRLYTPACFQPGHCVGDELPMLCSGRRMGASWLSYLDVTRPITLLVYRRSTLLTPGYTFHLRIAIVQTCSECHHSVAIDQRPCQLILSHLTAQKQWAKLHFIATCQLNKNDSGAVESIAHCPLEKRILPLSSRFPEHRPFATPQFFP